MSRVEKHFSKVSPFLQKNALISFITVKNFSKLGLLSALRFLEWVSENPEGTVSLPTGKTPEYFIKWVNRLTKEWESTSMTKVRHNHGLVIDHRPELKGLRFIQIDEFYPIDPLQHNSFHHYVQNYYLKDFGLDAQRALLINCREIPTEACKPFEEVFPNYSVDLSLRYRDPQSNLEESQKKTIHLIDQWCTEYEDAIREMGGIGFFLGGIGPDGHIAFNVRGSDHHSTTRLMKTNFETQASAAIDLGGIEVSKNRLVITIGLETITMNNDSVAIIIAAGEAKAEIVRSSIETESDIEYPASVLQKLLGARFYLTEGAASRLTDVQMHRLKNEQWSQKKTERAIISLCSKLKRFGSRLKIEDLRDDAQTALIPQFDDETVPSVIKSLKAKIEKGLKSRENEIFFHTGPHHDDITLGYLPFIAHLVRSPKNKHHFCTLTSGFTSVTNSYVMHVLRTTKQILDKGLIQMVDYDDFFSEGYKRKWDKDVFHYLDRIASFNREGCQRGLAHRLVRCLISIYCIQNKKQLEETIESIISYIESCYEGEKNSPKVQRLKGMIREFEEALVWSHYGVQTKDISHLRLGFYKGEIFTESPDRQRDVLPILEKLREVQPTVITLALDPEGSGPDTHYKVFQVLAEAVRMWNEERNLTELKIWGYRNVWYRFNPAEADIIVPISLNSMATLRDTFLTCYLSQKDASFPSYELDGPFCDLVQKIWVEQIQSLQLVLGRDFWYQNEHPRLRAAHGALFLREMTVQEFLCEARKLEEAIEGS